MMQAAHGELEGRIQELTAQLEEAQAAAASPGQHTKALASDLIWCPCISALHAVFPTLQQTEQKINCLRELSDVSKH